MTTTNWTNEQQDAIRAQNGTVLVSAAAGSGKTAVLVQRAISRMTEGESPVPADRMLIVTFTRAAAAEMRARLEKRLYEMLRADPKNDFLKRQSILLSQASIGTIHSFCADILREFFHQLDIPADFKIISDKQEEEMKNDTAAQTLSYAAENGLYATAADQFTGERDDRRLAALLLGLYEHMTSYPDPMKWLADKISLYETAGAAGESPWGGIILDYTGKAAVYCQNLLRKALHLLTDSGDEKLQKAYLSAHTKDAYALQQVLESAQKRDWDRTRTLVLNFSLKRAAAPRGYAEDPLTLKIKALLGGVKDTFRKSLDRLFASDEAQCREEFSQIRETLQVLFTLIEDFTARYSAKKLEKGFLDYADLEQYMLRLLRDENGGKTMAAQQISERFTEIMIDEYQDMNEVQDTIFSYVSQERRNLFTVGDVKQSIYGFRRAMPEIFMRSRDAFSRYDREAENYPSYIVLERNFRSRENVTESVNFVFSQLMNRETAGMDYTEEEALVCGASYPPKAGCETELTLLQRESGELTEAAEAAFIAGRIRELMAAGFTVQENGAERPARYGDFCILLRSANSYAHAYAEGLQRAGVPARASVSGGFFEAREVGAVLSFLRVIDNPNQDIPLLSVLMSPVYGFTPDDMLALRKNNTKSPLYTLLLQAGGDDPRYERFLRDLTQYRAACATMPSDEFIQFLYLKTGYPDMVLAMPDGENRLANLRLLQKQAHDYEASGYNGISGFIRFIDKLSRNRSDMKSAEIVESHENCVQIMSIHKSKGLEFPVCFVAGCGRGKNTGREEILFHPELGLGIRLADTAAGVRYTTMAREAIALDNTRRESAEEMRILYVAMTRAKEKLILVGTPRNAGALIEKCAAQVTAEGIAPYTIQTAGSFAEWLVLCALRHPDAAYLRSSTEADADIILRQHYTPWEIRVLPPAELSADIPEPPPAEPEPDAALEEHLRRVCSFVYPHAALTEIPSKAAASALAAKEQESAEGLTLSRPGWLFEKRLTPAEKGIALHSYMQFADFHSAAADPETELSRLVRQGYITAEQAAAVDLSRVSSFFAAPLGQRILRSPLVEKERRFTVEIPASEAGFAVPSAPVILQGALDCTFVEEGLLHIVDFKTDRIQNVRELSGRYAVQLRLYRQAMEQISEIPVGECWIYSMYRSKAVQVEAAGAIPAAHA